MSARPTLRRQDSALSGLDLEHERERARELDHAATSERNPYVDLLRVGAICAVMIGHWLMTDITMLIITCKRRIFCASCRPSLACALSKGPPFSCSHAWSTAA